MLPGLSALGWVFSPRAFGDTVVQEHAKLSGEAFGPGLQPIAVEGPEPIMVARQ